MNTTIAPRRGHRLASVAAFVAAAAALWGYGAYESLAFKTIAWGPFVVAALLGAAAYGFGRASALSQVLARGIAWSVLAPAVLLLGGEAADHGGRVDTWPLALTATLAIGLLIARPLLETERARRDFHPVAVRRALLSGSIASVATAIWTSYGTVVAFGAHHAGIGLGLATATTALVASGAGVVRMRGWGVLLGALTSTALVVAALFTRDYARLVLALAAAPGALLGASVLFARTRQAPAPLPLIRVAEPTTVRARIAVDEDFELPAPRAETTTARHPAGATIA